MSPIEIEILSAYLLGNHRRVRELMQNMDPGDLWSLKHTFDDLSNSCEGVYRESQVLD